MPATMHEGSVYEFVFWENLVRQGRHFNFFLGGAKFFFQCHRTKNWEKQHFICINLTLFIVHFLCLSFFFFFSLFAFLLSFFLFFLVGEATAPQPIK